MDIKSWAVAGKFETLMARMFGKKGTGKDGPCTVTAYLRRGKIYVTDVIVQEKEQ